ncbi:MAG: hypothetical protein KatS3mg087_1845 [Patescibacteria group bacterium]|nr:MAG: hypothetical protein KatS3mg087_1845 [Patescibacteria group bacterium]
MKTLRIALALSLFVISMLGVLFVAPPGGQWLSNRTMTINNLSSKRKHIRMLLSPVIPTVSWLVRLFRPTVLPRRYH